MGDLCLNCLFCENKDNEIKKLNAIIEQKDEKIRHLASLLSKYCEKLNCDQVGPITNDSGTKKLSNTEIMRYSRQMILPEIGMSGQKRVKETSVLIVGAGGLGCPAGLYLAGCGVGKIGVVDYDDVEVNNLHRQILHNEDDVGTPKCESFARSLRKLNSSTTYDCHKVMINSKNAEAIISNYDIILDASDNVPTRYLLSDACVLLQKPLVSGSALRFEGQLTVYNYKGSPCYRCLYPNPPSPAATSNCSESGVIGPVTGVIGCLQALEVVKIAVGVPPSFANKLLQFDGETGQFRIFKLRGKRSSCAVCGENPEIHKLIDYETFCGTRAADKVENVHLLQEADHVSCEKYRRVCDDNEQHVLLDVRASPEFEICSLPNSVNIPLNKLQNADSIEKLRLYVMSLHCDKGFVICRRGNDSQRAVLLLRESLKDLSVEWYDVKGGLEAWHQEVDKDFPMY